MRRRARRKAAVSNKRADRADHFSASRAIKKTGGPSASKLRFFPRRDEIFGVGQETSENTRYYSPTRYDRSGAVIHDLLMCHSYLTSKGQKYSGGLGGDKPVTEELLRSLGLWDVLKLHKELPRYGKLLDPKSTYRSHNALDAYYTDEWTKKMARAPRAIAEQRFPKSGHRVTVHVRRGDVTATDYPTRYLDNSYYLEQVEKYRRAGGEVIVFSQKGPTAAFDDFRAIGCVVKLDTPLDEVWLTAINSDVFVMSRSSFSHVPALLTKGIVVYHPYWHRPQDDWIVTSPTTKKGVDITAPTTKKGVDITAPTTVTRVARHVVRSRERKKAARNKRRMRRLRRRRRRERDA